MQDRKEQSRAEVARLVERYQRLSVAQVRAYDEEDTKKDFILPLFKALGWDVDEKEEVAAEVSAYSSVHKHATWCIIRAIQ